jgi:hypothetical protein
MTEGQVRRPSFHKRRKATAMQKSGIGRIMDLVIINLLLINYVAPAGNVLDAAKPRKSGVRVIAGGENDTCMTFRSLISSDLRSHRKSSSSQVYTSLNTTEL